MYIYFSPHPDDIVLSCGGYLLKKTGHRQLVINIFTKSYRGQTYWDKICGQGININTRIKEDKKILSSINVKSIYLDFFDGAFINKRPFLSSLKLFIKLAYIIKKKKNYIEAVFFPFGKGHPDHVLLGKIGKLLKKIFPDIKFYFYEDFPYISRKHAIKAKKIKVDISLIFEKRINLVLSYKSQLKAILKTFYPEIKLPYNIKTEYKKILINHYSNGQGKYYENLYYL
jgi:LmbE family N-acetylglucosaminyl deacetylase